MLTQAFWTSLRIVAFRSGPEDMPYDQGRQLSAACIVFALIAKTALDSVRIAMSPMNLHSPLLAAMVLALATVMALAVFTRLILRTRQLDNRFQQTFNALLLTDSILSLALLPPMRLLAPLVPGAESFFEKVQQHPELASDPAAMPQWPPWAELASLLVFGLFVWQFAVTVFIYRRAANTRTGGAIFITLLCLMTVVSFQTVFSMFIR